MTDLEICERIAEIEGYEKTGTVWGECVIVSNEDDTASYNPLTDKALCFDLMVRHFISLINVKDSTASYAVWDDSTPLLNRTETGTNPQRAICLAIIAKYEAQHET